MVRLKTGFLFSSGHVQTLFPPIFRPKARLSLRRQRLETSDGDFVDLDWVESGRERLVLILHGLEGHSRRKYVMGMARAARLSGFDSLAMNFRGCSGEPNRKIFSYHSGWTQDLHETLLMVQGLGRYQSVDVIGFSLGGNMLLKYLGAEAGVVPDLVRRAVAISVPCDLEDASRVLARPACSVYSRYLLDQLCAKIKIKDGMFPGVLDLTRLERIRTFQEFDDRFTAPMNGFRDAVDYWRKSSSRQFLPGIRRRTCIMNAANDPFLGARCYPHDEVCGNDRLCLLVPPTGGHVGFVGSGSGGMYWSEWMAMQFLCNPDGGVVREFSSA